MKKTIFVALVIIALGLVVLFVVMVSNNNFMTNSVQDDQPSDIGEETISFEDVVSEARIELSKPDPDEQPYPGAKAMRVLIQAQSLVDGGKVPDLMTQDRSLLEEYERTTKQEARTTLIERINRDLSTLLDEIETHADEDE